MDAVPDATDEDIKTIPNIIFTFHRWMVRQGRKEATARTYARQMIVLFQDDGKSPEGMASKEYFDVTKASLKNKIGNSQRSASVKCFMEFWADHRNKPMEDSGGATMYQVKVVPSSKRRSEQIAALTAQETAEARKLRAELELPREGWSVVVRNRESGDLITAVSPGGTAYYTREAVDRRLGRTPSQGALGGSSSSASKKEESLRKTGTAKAAEAKAPAKAPEAKAAAKAPAKAEAKSPAKATEAKAAAKAPEAKAKAGEAKGAPAKAAEAKAPAKAPEAKVAKAPEPKAGKAPEAKAAAKAVDAKAAAAAKAAEKKEAAKPPAKAAEPKPPAKATDAKASKAAEPKPPAKAPEAKASAKAPEPKSPAKAQEPKAPAKAPEAQAQAKATEPKGPAKAAPPEAKSPGPEASAPATEATANAASSTAEASSTKPAAAAEAADPEAKKDGKAAEEPLKVETEAPGRTEEPKAEPEAATKEPSKEDSKEPKAESEATTKEPSKEDSKDDILAKMKIEVDAMFEDAESLEQKAKKPKIQVQEVSPGDLTTPSVETDTEYAEVDLSDCPQKIHIQASGNHKFDGSYSRLSAPSRGKPCYVKWGEKQPSYLFWNKKWKIGLEFGSTKAYAYAKDAGPSTPCEPYPSVWRVVEKKDKKEKKEKGKEKEAKSYIKNLAMRVIDGAVLDIAMESDALRFLQPDEDILPVRKTRRRERSQTSASRAGQAAEADKGTPARPETVDADAPSEGSQEEDEQESSREGSESNSSDSSSSASASESDSEEQRPKAKAAPQKPSREQASEQKASGFEQKASEFETKLRYELSKLKDAAARQRKLDVVKDMLQKRSIEQVTGMGPEKVQLMLDRLSKDFSMSKPPLPKPINARPPSKPKPPPGPPPQWMLEKLKQEGGAPGRAAEEQQLAVPTTPDQGSFTSFEADAAATRHKGPKRSALRKPGMPRQTARRVSYLADGWMVNQVSVTSYRREGEQLWFVQPGSFVICDRCEKEVPQAMGSLQGAVGQSQFAQSLFICSDCAGY